MGRPHRFYENRVLRKYFHTDRILDAQGRGSADGKTDWLSIELFQRDIPQYQKDELQQSIDASEGGQLLPIAVQREKGKRDDDALVFMRLSDFVEWFGDDED